MRNWRQPGRRGSSFPPPFAVITLTVLEALTVNSNPEPFISFARNLIELNSHMPFGSFEQSLQYFKQTGALG